MRKWEVRLSKTESNGYLKQYEIGLSFASYDSAQDVAYHLAKLRLWDYIIVTDGVEEHTFPGR